MEIDYEIGPEDMVDYNWHIYSSPARRKRRLTKLLTVTSLLALLGLILLESPNPGFVQLGIMSLGAAGTLLLLGLFLAPIAIRRQMVQFFGHGKPSAIYGWRRISIDPERIMQEAEFMLTVWKWPAVERIEVSSHLVLFFIDQAMALIVPRSAFADEATLLAFVETAERFQRAVQRPAAAI
jgi:YcxB-like protein